MRDDHDQPHRWYTTNLVGVPAPVLGGVAFQAHPVRLSIAGARASHGGLFSLLDRAGDAAEAREMFGHYMSLAFGLQPAEGCVAERRRWKVSYLKLLQGWGMDANGAAGAVLKGWVESRFGLVPSFHKAPLQRFPSPAWIGYLEEKAASRWHNNSIWQQLDLLYEFCQWMLARFALLPEAVGPHVRLWRGSTRVEEQLVRGTLRERHCVVRLNNLVSFARSREEAECFGDWVFETQVPLAKLLFVPGLVKASLLQGEAEVIAIGGDHVVEARYAL
ncbi:NAD(+)--dinitrogen-reductase ADP-D-ribosyltransferase [Ideonella sp. DXS22W]|uniref:NAD(+)--dinitrogen-reductase ADP-D-ribosyltransferase n=1 Tax=Pseudaquabacterium inlustre TaxID=2984192 RepID=A0ABU9CPF5_9BURK